MPSKAYSTFTKNVQQVDRLLEAYDLLQGPKRGKRKLDHLTRAALMFLCSSWEVYIEQVANESGEKIAKNINEIKKLPKKIKKTIAKQINKNKNDEEAILFIDSWREYYLGMLDMKTKGLNTPKQAQVTELFEDYLGINKDLIDSSILMISEIDEIIVTRGEVAHNVFAERYLKKNVVDKYYDIIKMAVRDVDVMLYNYIPSVVDKGKKPWNNTY
ncbi:MAG: hypothetical protein E7249_14600 [Paenibacillaceae bacterium]|nr:hypothetical protein [Paenibacillaceae bacterium]